MNHWADRLRNILYIHYRFIVMGIVFVGGCVAGGVVYVFLFTSASLDDQGQQLIEAPIKKDALERVYQWNALKERQATTSIDIDDAAFDLPVLEGP